MLAHKAFRGGTHRVRHPRHTWELIAPLLDNYGVTRVADVTGLDVLGVPVAMAVRPLARTLTVSQGKGQTLLLAKISAAMESMELWHAEFRHPRSAHDGVPAVELDLPYRIEQVSTGPAALVTEYTPLDWVTAIGLDDGAMVPVPARIVTVPADQQSWVVPGLRWDSNGLASGNSREEAAVHALYEIVERDAVSGRPHGSADYVDPASITDPSCAGLIARIRAGGATLRVVRVPNRFGVSCFGATVWSQEFPVTCLGWGAHLDAAVAVSRAVTEAAQSRLTAIAGSRDDLPAKYQHVRSNTEEHKPISGPVLSWSDVGKAGPGSFDDVNDELAWLAGRVTEATGMQPLCVDLSTVDEFAVVKVLAPAAAFDQGRVHAVG